jgi:hypothetical protein
VAERRRHHEDDGDALAADLQPEADQATTWTAIALAESGGRSEAPDPGRLDGVTAQRAHVADPGAGTPAFGVADADTPAALVTDHAGAGAPAALPEVDDQGLVAFTSGDAPAAPETVLFDGDLVADPAVDADGDGQWAGALDDLDG